MRKHGPFPLEAKRPGRVRVKPITHQEWQEAADIAHLMLALDSCYQYGLLTGPTVRVGRCYRILREAAKRGIKPKDILK